jgi:hypothetical protein
VYKRRTAWGKLDQYELFVNTWSVKGENQFHKDFDLFSSYEDALADKNAWKWCNGDDKGVGFPRDCAASRKTNWRWFAFPKNTELNAEVDFIKRFDMKYLHSKNKCYHQATFEILPGQPEVVPEPEVEVPEKLSPEVVEPEVVPEVEVELPECPVGWEQVGEVGTDIAGCGLQKCNERYDLANAQECAKRCSENEKCKSFNWAPLDGDKNHKGERVCTMYSHATPNRMWEGINGVNQQVFCVPKAQEPEVAIEVEEPEVAVEVPAGAWKTVIDIELNGNAKDSADLITYTHRVKFNEMAAKATYIRYRTNKIGTAVYKRRTAWGSIDQYELFVNHWSIKGENQFHKDFDIFSSYEDALADKNAWQYCNGDDMGVGFPRDCAAKNHTNWRWFAFPKNTSTIPEYVDFIHRFDINYLHSKNKCYSKATFEIFGEFEEEAPVEVEKKEPAVPEETSENAADYGAVYIGCFNDSHDRDLKHRKGAFAVGDREHCFKACQDAGYQFAGLQSKGQCFCGDDYGRHGKGKNCEAKCARDSKDFGLLSNCVYDVNYFYMEITKETEHHWSSSASWSIQSRYTGCAGAGELYSLYYDHVNKDWLPEMFEAKDDAAWLLRLYEEKQISEFQYNWLTELFEKKAKQDCGDEANLWWHDVFTNGFHEDHVPDFIKEHTNEQERRMAAVTDGQGALIV